MEEHLSGSVRGHTVWKQGRVGSLSRYKIWDPIGAGAYGTVYAASDDTPYANREAPQYAIKEIYPHDNATKALRTLREIKLLRHLSHKNIVPVLDIVGSANLSTFSIVHLVLPYMDFDLSQVIYSDEIKLDNEHHRSFLYQILCGVRAIHAANVIHRDLKPSNILLNWNGDVKICDFGLARVSTVSSDAPTIMTEYVATRWYRAPEVILTSRYDASMDIWSIGCIFAEMLLRQVLFRGRNTVDQIFKIAQIVGSQALIGLDRRIEGFVSASPENWSSLRPIPRHPRQLLRRLLTVDPNTRVTASDALEHSYFGEVRDPDDVNEVSPVIPSEFAFETERSRLTSNELKRLLHHEVMRRPEFLGAASRHTEGTINQVGSNWLNHHG